MKVNMQFNTISYKPNRSFNILFDKGNSGSAGFAINAKNVGYSLSAKTVGNSSNAKSAGYIMDSKNAGSMGDTGKRGSAVPNTDMVGKHISIKRLLTQNQTEQKNQNSCNSNSILSSSLSYSEQLKAQRENTKKTALEKKKLIYKFKDISSQIIRSKTSQSARGAVNAAKREVMKLKKQKASGEYDPEEIEAAIAHAKTMERVARKKVRHLEEEEMAKAADGPCNDNEIEKSDKLSENPNDSEEESEELKDDDFVSNENYEAKELEISEDLKAMAMRTEVMTSEMMSEMEEELQEMLEELGFGELQDLFGETAKDMDPSDIKMMKIKHRCKEMKEITKADSEYLKAVFDSLEKAKGSVNVPVEAPSINSGMGNVQSIDISI